MNGARDERGKPGEASMRDRGINAALHVVSGAYRMAWALERRFFATFGFLRHRAGRPVISVGNLSMGGTGKTPVIAALLEELRDRRPCLVTRGYRSPFERGCLLLGPDDPSPDGLTDEIVMLRQRFPWLAIAIGKNRAHAVRMAQRLLPVGVFVLDDGFQYRRLARDLDLVCIDVTAPPHRDALLPAGRLREPVERLREADALLLTRVEQVPASELAEMEAWLTDLAPAVPRLRLETRITGWIGPDGHPASPPAPPVVAFAAIGQPESFATQLRQIGLPPVATRWFRDHHRYQAAEYTALTALAQAQGAKLVCTEKDRVKLLPAWCLAAGVWTVQIAMTPVSGTAFTTALNTAGVRCP